jgi:hypothetical protein
MKKTKGKRGICRICGCTPDTACVLATWPDGASVGALTCSWKDETETLCTNPACVEKAREGE